MRLEVLFVRYFDVGQNPVMINKDGIMYRLDTNNLIGRRGAESSVV
jgi:hypothetical protein